MKSLATLSASLATNLPPPPLIVDPVALEAFRGAVGTNFSEVEMAVDEVESICTGLSERLDAHDETIKELWAFAQFVAAHSPTTLEDYRNYVAVRDKFEAGSAENITDGMPF